MRRPPGPATPLRLPTGWWGHRHGAGEPRSVVRLLEDGVLDAELAALVWLLFEARIPLLVAGEASGVGKTTLLTALLEFLPPGVRAVALDGAAEDFGWLPEAPELGWRPERADRPAPTAGSAASSVSPGPTSADGILLVAELSDHLPQYTWGPQARIAIRALAIGYGLAATIHADRLEDVFERLRSAPVHLSDDELSRLGVVLVLRQVDRPDGTTARRVVAAHYVRPVVRDVHGHVQRMPPAVLAAYEARTDELEHFAWGLTAELAARVGRSPADFDREVARRAEFLRALLATGVTQPEAVRLALAAYLGVGERPVG